MLAAQYFDYSRFEQAAECFSAFAQVYTWIWRPDDPSDEQVDALFVVPLVAALRSMGAVDEAENIIQKALTEHPTLVELRLAQAEVLMERGELQAALEHSRAAVQVLAPLVQSVEWGAG